MTKLISDLLDRVRVQGTAYFSRNVEPPWGMDVEQHEDLCRFHLVLAGSTWVGLADGSQCEQLWEGDFAIVPRGQAHYLDDQPGRETRTHHHIPDLDESFVGGFDRLEQRGNKTHILCGYFHFTQELPLVIHSRLPDLMVTRNTGSEQSKQISLAIKMLEQELSRDADTPQPILNRLTEIIFYYSLNGWLSHATLPGESLHAIVDPKLQRVLDTIHQNPLESWTVESLAELTGQSRTAFANHFKEAIGMSPIAYLTYWRFVTARKLLSESGLDLSRINSASCSRLTRFSFKFDGRHSSYC